LQKIFGEFSNKKISNKDIKQPSKNFILEMKEKTASKRFSLSVFYERWRKVLKPEQYC